MNSFICYVGQRQSAHHILIIKNVLCNEVCKDHKKVCYLFLYIVLRRLNSFQPLNSLEN